MKKNRFFQNIIIMFAALLFIFLSLVVSTHSQSKSETEQQQKLHKLSEIEIRQIIEHRANAVITALKEKNISQLSKCIHPIKGVRLSPYAFIDSF